MPGNISVRRLAQDAEKPHHKQKRAIAGVTYLVSKEKAPSMVAVTASRGFTEVKDQNERMPTQEYKPQAQGGDQSKKVFSQRTRDAPKKDHEASRKRASRNFEALCQASF